MGRKIELGGMKYYSPSPNKKSGTPATLTPGVPVTNLEYLETVKAEKSIYKDRYNHKFLEDGKVVVFNGSSMLDKLIEQVAPGDVVNITYKGQEACPFGTFKGKPTHTYEVEYADDEATGDDERADTPGTDAF
jgi:hypothetical protein